MLSVVDEFTCECLVQVKRHWAVHTSRAEIGATWSKRLGEDRHYLGLKLDDPSFTALIYANLFDDEDGEASSLMWSRTSGRRD